jgi:hypothetical protein
MAQNVYEMTLPEIDVGIAINILYFGTAALSVVEGKGCKEPDIMTAAFNKAFTIFLK